MASKAIGFLNFKFGADLSGFDRAMKKAQKNLKKFGRNIQKTGKSLTMGLTLPIVALGTASVKAFDEQQKAIAQVEAGLKSTAGAVGITSEELQKMAADLQKTTLFGDEEILKGATAQLLTFTNITGEQFKKTQAVALDLATRLDGDLKSASIMLGKALNDPVANLSALSRAGIQFSIEQKETIKSLVETNRLADAQTIILAELEKQYGGSAEAAALAGMGPIKQLQNELSDLSEQIGERLLPYIQSFVSWITRLAEKFDGLSESTKDNIVKWGLILAAIGPVLIIIGKMSIGISALIPLFSTLSKVILSNPYLALGAAVLLVVKNIYELNTALSSAELIQNSLNNINENAIASTLIQTTKIKDLTSTINDETISLEDKETALRELQKISPKYYNTFSTIEGNIKAITSATQDLTAELLLNAKVTGAQDELARLFEAGADQLGSFKRFQSLMETGVIPAVTGSDLLNVGKENVTAAKKTIEQINEITSVLNIWEKDQRSLNKELKAGTINIDDLEDKTEDLTKDTKDLTGETKQYSDAVEDNIIKLGDQFQQYSLATDQYEDIYTWTTRLTDAQKLGAAGFEMFGDILTSSLDSALDNQENFFKLFIKNIQRAIRSLLIQLAVMTLIQALMGGGGAAFKLSNIKTNLMGLMNIPGLAEGGLVTSPQTVLVGEGVGTTASNPEVVAPLDKLKSMIGGGNQNITVTGKLIGNDIFLSNSKTGFNRQRTV